MDLYETTQRSNDRDIRREFSRLLARYEMPAKYFLALAATVGVGFGLRFVFENRLGQVFGAMLVWFSLLFGAAGVLFTGLFLARGVVADRRHD